MPTILKPKKTALTVRKGSPDRPQHPKFSLRRVDAILDMANLDLHDLNVSYDAGELTLSVDAIDLSRRNRLAFQLQKRAIPKSDWTFVKDTAQTFGNINGRIVTLLVFTARKDRKV